MELSVESLSENIGIACQKVCTKMVSFVTDRSWGSIVNSFIDLDEFEAIITLSGCKALR